MYLAECPVRADGAVVGAELIELFSCCSARMTPACKVTGRSDLRRWIRLHRGASQTEVRFSIRRLDQATRSEVTSSGAKRGESCRQSHTQTNLPDAQHEYLSNC